MLRLLALVAVLAMPAVATERDWRQTLETDSRAWHAEQAANHPGPHNQLDPGFPARLDAALAGALQRAGSVRTPGGYMFAMREMVARFNDGHMYIGFNDTLDVQGQWPGFIAAYRDGALVVRHAEAGTGMAIGDRILGCDGRNPEALLAELVAPWRGGWDLVAERERHGWRVFHDYGNPWVKRPARCRVGNASAERDITLEWRPEPDKFTDLVARTATGRRAPIALRDFAGGSWISAGSFSAAEGTAAEIALPVLVDAVRARQQSLREAPLLVLDVRGNTGGSSDWGAQLARLLWSPAAIARIAADRDKAIHVDWRATPANLAAIDAFCGPALAGNSGASPEALDWCRASTSGLAGAIARGDPLWREPDGPSAAATVAPQTFAPRTKPTYVLTDSACGSACLDTVDLWTALGAVPVGRTTSADSDYMEVRDIDLPSGLGSFSVPIKVYRGRPRGSNVPVEPAHRFDGDMGDDAAL
ncbi:S41 family peptidase, partial [Polymorphobacter multimanifer]